ncbi:MAG: hypothetical protein ACRCXZ_05790, partial [Patescibacteria group bacterium]
MSFTCDNCGLGFTSNRSLGFHLKKCKSASNVNTTTTSYQCPFCFPIQRFTNAQVLSRHLKTHNQKPQPLIPVPNNDIDQNIICEVAASTNEENDDESKSIQINNKRLIPLSNEHSKRQNIGQFDDVDLSEDYFDANYHSFDVDYNPFKIALDRTAGVIAEKRNDTDDEDDVEYYNFGIEDDDLSASANGEVMVDNSVQKAVDMAICQSEICDTDSTVNLKTPFQNDCTRDNATIRQSCQVELL